MKKLSFVLIAAVLAIGFSAFTTVNPPVTVYYQDDGAGPWLNANLTPCPSGTLQECIIETPHGEEQIFVTAGGLPYTRKP